MHKFKITALLIIIMFLLMNILISPIIAETIVHSTSLTPSTDVSINPSIQIVNVGAPESYLLIKKSLIPNKEFYLKSDRIRVCVEITSLRFIDVNKPLKNVKFYEVINDYLTLIQNSSQCYKVNDVEDFKKYLDQMYNKENPDYIGPTNYKISWNNGTGATDNISIQGRDRFVYWYDVKPKEYGTFNTETIIRSEIYSDIERILEVIVKKPEPVFDVNMMVNKTQIYKNEPLNIIYAITYLGDSDSLNDIQIIIDEPTNYYKYSGNESETETNLKQSFSKYKTFPLQRHLIFLTTGIYSIPGITINGIRYTFNDPIIVDSIFTRNWGFFTNLFYLFSISSLLLLIYINFKTGMSLSRIKLNISLKLKKLIDTIPRLIRIPLGICIIGFGISYLLHPENLYIETYLLQYGWFMGPLLVIIIGSIILWSDTVKAVKFTYFYINKIFDGISNSIYIYSRCEETFKKNFGKKVMRSIDSIPQLIRIVLGISSIAFGSYLLLNDISILLGIFLALTGLAIFVYDFICQKNVYAYWILLWLVSIVALLLDSRI